MVQGSRAAGRPSGLHSARLSLPDCCRRGRGRSAHGPRAMRCWPCRGPCPCLRLPFDDLITELGGAVEEDHPLSAGLDTLDMQLPSMELTPDMQGELAPSLCHMPVTVEPPLTVMNLTTSNAYSRVARQILPGIGAHAAKLPTILHHDCYS